MGNASNRRTQATGATHFVKEAPRSRPETAPKTPVTPPTQPPTMGDVLLALQAVSEQSARTEKLLVQHIAEEREERKLRQIRYEGVMTILGDLITRLPDASPTP